MIYKIVTCLSILTVSAYENDVQQKYAISSQSFSRPEISFKFSNVHDYRPRHSLQKDQNKYQETIPNPVRYPSIQYAPLNGRLGDYQIDQTKVRHPETTSESPVEYINEERHVDLETNALEKPKYYHLEPKPLKEDDNVNQQNYKSFISGHNVEVYPQTTGQYLENDGTLATPKIIYHKSQEESPRKFMYYQKPTPIVVPGPGKKHPVIQLPKLTDDYNLLQFLPPDYNSPLRNDQKKSIAYADALHTQLIKEKQQQTYQHPRIHLNIARVYNIANHPQEGHLPVKGKQPTLSAASFYLPRILNGQNTIMYPVRSPHRENSVFRL